MKNVILVDTSNLCHICYHSYCAKTPKNTISFRSIVGGIFTRLLVVSRTFKTDKFVFAIDSTHVYRKDMDSSYKSKRKKNLVVVQLIEEFVKTLRKIGFKNIVEVRGYEADDIIAGYAKKLRNCVIMSNDQDFFQCLSKTTKIYNITSRLTFTKKDLKEKYKISPKQWKMVKAIGGCTSDGVVGIPRVGEKTAIKYLLKQLTSSSAYYKRIKENKGLLKHSTKLVSLPFTKTMKLPPLKVEKNTLNLRTRRNLFLHTN